jgi:small subunit ribosomal protein S19e
MAKVIYAKDPVKYIPALAEALKGLPEFESPEWAFYVKTGSSRERPPADEDFWYVRSASILRHLYLRGVVGVGKLRNRYGSRKDRGGRPDRFRKAGGKIIRVILQQAEEAGLVEKLTRLQHGRRLTEKGREFLDSIQVEEGKKFIFEDLKAKPVEIGDIQGVGEDSLIEEVRDLQEDKITESVSPEGSPSEEGK